MRSIWQFTTELWQALDRSGKLVLVSFVSALTGIPIAIGFVMGVEGVRDVIINISGLYAIGGASMVSGIRQTTPGRTNMLRIAYIFILMSMVLLLVGFIAIGLEAIYPLRFGVVYLAAGYSILLVRALLWLVHRRRAPQA